MLTQSPEELSELETCAVRLEDRWLPEKEHEIRDLKRKEQRALILQCSEGGDRG